MIFKQTELENLETLCPNVRTLLGGPGQEGIFSDDDYEETISTELPHAVRIKMLVSILKNYLSQMIEEKKEYDTPEESERLRAEATGIILSIREIYLHFPELVKNEANHSEYELKGQ